MGWDEGHFLTDWAVLAESLDSVKESLRLPRGPACALTQRRGGRGSRWPRHWTAPCRLRRPLHPQMRTRLEEDTALPFLLQRPQHTRRRAARRASANAEAVRSKVSGLSRNCSGTPPGKSIASTCQTRWCVRALGQPRGRSPEEKTSPKGVVELGEERGHSGRVPRHVWDTSYGSFICRWGAGAGESESRAD